MRSADFTTTPTRKRGVEFSPLPTARRLAIGAERAGRRRAALHYLMTADITTARRLIAMSPDTLSLTAFLTASVARTAARHPMAHAYRDWRGRLVTHRHVDVAVPVETLTDHGPHPVPHVVADADLRDIAEISAELLTAKYSPMAGAARFFEHRPGLARVPGLLRAMYAVQGRSVRLRQRIGTVAITNTGMYDVGETFGVTTPALMPLQVTFGSICAAPHQTSNFIERHEILNLTLTFDRGLVGEDVAAAFATDLCHAVEHAEVLQAHISVPPRARLFIPAAKLSEAAVLHSADTAG